MGEKHFFKLWPFMDKRAELDLRLTYEFPLKCYLVFSFPIFPIIFWLHRLHNLDQSDSSVPQVYC